MTDKSVALEFQSELEFGNVGFWRGEGKTGVPGEKSLGARTRTNNKLNPHLTPSPGIEPAGHHGGRPAWEANSQPLRHPLLSVIYGAFKNRLTINLHDHSGHTTIEEKNGQNNFLLRPMKKSVQPVQ